MKNIYTRTPVIIGSILALSAPLAHADWKGDLHIKIPPQKNGPSQLEGKVAAKRQKQRMDMTVQGMEISTIVDHGAKKAWSLVHPQKMAMVMNLDEVQAQIPACDGSNMESCFKSKNYKKTGTERIDGHPCDIWEGTNVAHGKTQNIKIWHPTDLNEVPAVKTLVTEGGKLVGETTVTNVQIASVADSQFTVPSGYQTMANMGARPAGAPDHSGAASEGAANGGGRNTAGRPHGMRGMPGNMPSFQGGQMPSADQMREMMKNYRGAQGAGGGHEEENEHGSEE